MSFIFFVCPGLIACESQIPLLEYLLHSSILSMNIPLLTTPSLMPSRIVVVWGCKNSFFLLRTHYATYFFKIFFEFLYCIEYQCFIWPFRQAFPQFFAFFVGFHDEFHRKFRRFLEIFCQNRIPEASKQHCFLCNFL